MANRQATNWYKDGICFSCTGCGGCCAGEPGYVWINDQEIDAMVDVLKIKRSEFMNRYTRVAEGKISLIEKPNYDCIFLENNGCSLYEARPIQCRTYPFWKSALRSKSDFIEATQKCPGTHLESSDVARHYTRKEIEEIAESSTL